MNALMQSVRETPAPPGTAVLWWLGQMGLLVKLGGTVLCVDYYASLSPDRRTPPPIPAEISSLFAEGYISRSASPLIGANGGA